MAKVPNYRLPQYGLSDEQLDTIAILKGLPAWERRKWHKKMSGGPSGPFVYRYLAFNSSDQFCMKKARDLVVESTLYLSSPSDFNDPYDFRAYITLMQDPAVRRQYFERSARAFLAAGNDPFPSLRGTRRKTEALVRRAMEKSISSPDNANEAFGRARDRNGVACFSEDPRGLLMWAHYSAGHTGICLQFDVTEDPGLLMLCHRVQYRDELPHLVWPRDKEDIVDKVILNKGRAWEVEKEVRYVSLHVSGDSLPFDGRALRAIILGARFPAASYVHIEKLIHERGKLGFPEPIVYQAQQRKQEYGVSFARRQNP